MSALSACPVRLKKGCEEAVRKGMPWIYASDIIESSELLSIPAGSLVAVENHKGQAVGTGYYNARSQIACRMLTFAREPIDVAFFKARLTRALELRDKLIGVPYYRLIHSEGDFLPGLLIDRFGDTLVVQAGTAGMEALQPVWIEALESLLAPRAVLLRNDASARTLEGLAKEVKLAKGEVPPLVEVQENGCAYLADLMRGQKTGWFYDQRDNRAMIAALAKGKTVADIYSHSGGFGVVAAKAGAAQVTMVDSSALALDLAMQAARKNKVDSVCETVKADAFEKMEEMNKHQQRFDIVLVDPPAFVKTKKDIAAGLRGYEKMARLAAPLVEQGGYMFAASCSHYAGRSAFNKAVIDGIEKAGCTAQIIKQTGAAPDHPIHKLLQQNEYLKGILVVIK